MRRDSPPLLPEGHQVAVARLAGLIHVLPLSDLDVEQDRARLGLGERLGEVERRPEEQVPRPITTDVGLSVIWEGRRAEGAARTDSLDDVGLDGEQAVAESDGGLAGGVEDLVDGSGGGRHSATSGVTLVPRPSWGPCWLREPGGVRVSFLSERGGGDDAITGG